MYNFLIRALYSSGLKGTCSFTILLNVHISTPRDPPVGLLKSCQKFPLYCFARANNDYPPTPHSFVILFCFIPRGENRERFISLGMSKRISFFELTNERWVRAKFSTNEELHNLNPIPRISFSTSLQTSLGICILSRFSTQRTCR